ncbi:MULTISPECIES: protein TolR [Marinimicrobium]|jgi:biopolymer transport protein TolR|uniref:Tol-Pal system protein TolR n=1 Tax=Marinimicrobium koreense TaxID=306545 RepID=A0A3N1NZ14_9GAMM|nr:MULTISPECIES: protein TolR [Marinimicrobium]MAN51881.1 protein TolR [Marinimicrobium sp.]ROQ19650.1 cell division and transport-associated protein TolR [Marinimicrobium koreense]
MSPFGRKPKKKPLAEINVVPYIDVMLVLLIVFMVTAPLLMQGVQVELPQAPSEPLEDDDVEPLIVSIKKDGTYYINLGGDQEQARPLAEIKETVGKVLRQKPETPVLVWGDQEVGYGLVVQLMTELQSAGAPSVGLVTEPPQ